MLEILLYEDYSKVSHLRILRLRIRTPNSAFEVTKNTDSGPERAKNIDSGLQKALKNTDSGQIPVQYRSKF